MFVLQSTIVQWIQFGLIEFVPFDCGKIIQGIEIMMRKIMMPVMTMMMKMIGSIVLMMLVMIEMVY